MVGGGGGVSQYCILTNVINYVSPTTRYDRRLLFKDLNENSILNGVNTGELLTLWTPELQFLNALGPYQTIVDDLNVCTILYA